MHFVSIKTFCRIKFQNVISQMVQKWYFDGVLLFVYPGTVAVVNDVVIVSIVFVVTVTVFTTNDGVPTKIPSLSRRIWSASKKLPSTLQLFFFKSDYSNVFCYDKSSGVF